AGTFSSRNGAITTSCFQEQAVVQPLTHVLRYPSKYAKAWVYQLESRWQDTHFYRQAKFFGWRKALHRRVHYATKDLGEWIGSLFGTGIPNSALLVSISHTVGKAVKTKKPGISTVYAMYYSR